MNRGRRHQPWEADSGTRARVLLECEPDATPSVIASVIERHGYAVRMCDGPRTHDCDLLDRGACSLVDGADVVVNMLHPPSEGPSVLDEMNGLRRPPALVAERAHPGAAVDRGVEAAATTEGSAAVTIVHTPVSEESLIGAIEDALDRATRPVPRWGDAHC